MILKTSFDDLKKTNIKINTNIDYTRPTTNKNTILSDVYKLLKVDKVDNQPISEKNLNKIKFFIRKIKCDAIIFSDFRHGIFNKTSIPELIKSIKKGVFKVADSQVATRWNITDFKNFDLITPNEKEARFSPWIKTPLSVLTRELENLPNLNLILSLVKDLSVVNKGLQSKAITLPSFAKVIDSN